MTLLIGIAATIVVGVIIYFKQKRLRKPRYYIRSHNLITDFSNKFDKMQILYDGTPVKNLTVSKIAFWNDGAETIRRENTTRKDPLRVESIGDCDIVDASVIMATDSVSEFRIQRMDSKQIRILFAFLDKGQGGIIQLIHTGKGSSSIKLDGYIESVGKPLPTYARNRVFRILDRMPRIFPSHKPRSSRTRRILASVPAFMSAVFMFVITFTASLSSSQLSLREESSVVTIGIIFALMYIYFGFNLLRRHVPKDFEIIDEED